MSAGLTAQDQAECASAGLLMAGFALTGPLLDTARHHLETLLRHRPDIPPERWVCPRIPAGPEHDAAAAAPWLGLATGAPLVDVVEALIGPDIILWGSPIFCKPPFTGREITWHQDGQYGPINPLAPCAAWIALDDAHCATSALRARQFPLHDVFFVHGPAAKVSPRRRAALGVRHLPGNSVLERDRRRAQSHAALRFDRGRRPIGLLRGEDRTRRNNFLTGHGEDYPLTPRVWDDA